MKAEERHESIESHNEEKWRAVIADQKQSGLKRTEYCRKHQLNYDKFGYWYRKVKDSVRPLIPIRIKVEPQHSQESKILGRLILSNGTFLELYDKETLLLIASNQTC